MARRRLDRPRHPPVVRVRPRRPRPRDEWPPDRLIRNLARAPLVDESTLDPRRRSIEEPLSHVELEVLRYLSRGLNQTQAADALDRPLTTVKSQLESARYRLATKTPTHACCEAIRRGLIP